MPKIQVWCITLKSKIGIDQSHTSYCSSGKRGGLDKWHSDVYYKENFWNVYWMAIRKSIATLNWQVKIWRYGNLGECVCLPYKCLSNYFSYPHFLSFGVFHWMPVCQVLCYSKITLFFFIWLFCMLVED